MNSRNTIDAGEVASVLEKNGLLGEWNIAEVLKALSGNYEEARKEMMEAADIHEKDVAYHCMRGLLSSMKIIRAGWLDFLNSKKNTVPQALNALINLYEKGYAEPVSISNKNECRLTIKPDIAKAAELRAEAMSGIAAANVKRKAYAEALAFSENTDRRVSAKAKYHLYQMIMRKEGCAFNAGKAFNFLMSAAEAGLPEANFELAEKLSRGCSALGIVRNNSKARAHYKKASMCYIPENQDFFSEDGRKIALTGNPVAQYICARNELSADRIEFAARLAAMAADGGDGECRRYYKAEREKNLYGILSDMLNSANEYSGMLSSPETSAEERKKLRMELIQELDKTAKQYRPFTPQEEETVAALKRKFSELL